MEVWALRVDAVLCTGEHWRMKHTQREDLPEQDAIGPDVTQRGVEVVKDALRSHPLHGEKGLQGRGGALNPACAAMIYSGKIERASHGANNNLHQELHSA